MFYVYEHWRPDTNICFYVGKGSGSRAWSMRGRNKHHKSIVKYLGRMGLVVDVRIVVSDLLEEAAFAVERDRIAFYGLGELVNQTLGGEGFVGGRHTEQSRKKISEASKAWAARNRHQMRERALGPKNPFWGKKHTEKSKEVLSAKLKGRPCPSRAPITDEQKKKISDTLKRKGIRPPSRKGTSPSAEVRAKQSASLKAHWAKKRETV